jgi:hypothetical protein
MRTPALAIGWAIWCQHRRGLVACALALVVMAIADPILFALTRSPAVVITSTVPLAGVYFVILNSLLVVEDAGSLASRSPKHRFVLPVRTHTLVFWPMLYGWIAAGSLWLATAGLIHWSSGFQTPLLLPALGMATLMVWMQAVSWLPIPNIWLRDTMTIVVLGPLAGLPVWLTYSDLTSPALVAALLIGYSAMAYPLGLIAVGSDRRGEVWRVVPGSTNREESATTSKPSQGRRPFRSAGEAQFWFEWRCHGLVLPGLVGLLSLVYTLLLTEIALTAPRPFNPNFFMILTMPVLMPVFLAGSVGRAIGQLTPPFGVNSRRFITFVLIRPMTSGGMVGAKLRMATLSVLLTWAAVAVAAALWMATAGRALGVMDLARGFFQPYANPKGLAFMLLGATLFVAVTWKQLTSGFACALSGRRWIAGIVALAHLAIVMGLVAAGFWLVNHPEVLPRIVSILPYLVACAAILKGAVAIVTFWAALRGGLITWSTVGSVLAVWLVLSACAFACVPLESSAPPPAISKPILLLCILVFMPLSRFALAPLALDWNRHR